MSESDYYPYWAPPDAEAMDAAALREALKARKDGVKNPALTAKFLAMLEMMNAQREERIAEIQASRQQAGQ